MLSSIAYSQSIAIKYQRINQNQSFNIELDGNVSSIYDLKNIGGQFGIEYSKRRSNLIETSFQMNVPTIRRSFNRTVNYIIYNGFDIASFDVLLIHQNFYFTVSRMWKVKSLQYGLGVGLNPNYTYFHIDPFEANRFPASRHNFNVTTYLKPQIRFNFKPKYFIVLDGLVNVFEFDANIKRQDDPSLPRRNQRQKDSNTEFSKYRMQFGIGIGCEI